MNKDFNNWIIYNRDSIHILYNQLKESVVFKEKKLDINKFEYFCYLNSSKYKYKYIASNEFR